MKKGKVISMPSTLEAQIRSRARNLPVYKCYVNNDWKDSQMATVIVTRKHANDNVTYACYLVDLMLLGVKDCFYEFNVTLQCLDDLLLSRLDEKFIECKYALAHNIVYDAIAFAEDYGFAPYSAFSKTGKYVLEEDTDDIPIMDIPLGDNGQPVVFITPENSMQREIAILEKTAGAGNYTKIWMDHDGDVEKGDFDEDEDSGEDEETYPDLMDEVFSTGIEAYIKKVKTTTSLLRMLVLIDFVYLSQFSAKDIKEINKTKEMILTDDRIYFNLERFSALEEFSDEIKVIVDKYSDDKKKYIKKMGELVDRHPDVPELNAVYFEALLVTKKNFRAYQFAFNRYNRTKDHYITRLMYAEYLVLMGKYKDALKLFDNKPGLDALTTENVPFTVKSVCDFCACYVLILLSINKIAEAEPYYLIIVESKNWGYFSLLAMEAMTKRKQKVVRKVLKEML